MILAGDVGGTKVHLALYSFDSGKLKPVRDEKVPATEFATLEAVVEHFLRQGEREQIVAACFGCPGPVRNGRLKLTNLPWTLDQHDLAQSLTELIDDLFAGRKRLEIYRQFKMYNDPMLNPQIYGGGKTD